jgi:hypothetical protein
MGYENRKILCDSKFVNMGSKDSSKTLKKEKSLKISKFSQFFVYNFFQTLIF